MDVLQAVDTLKDLNKQAQKNHGRGAPLALKQEELLLLQGAFALMRRTLDTLTPLVWNNDGSSSVCAPVVGRKPVLRLV
jgi:hypothetical protein